MMVWAVALMLVLLTMRWPPVPSCVCRIPCGLVLPMPTRPPSMMVMALTVPLPKLPPMPSVSPLTL